MDQLIEYQGNFLPDSVCSILNACQMPPSAPGRMTSQTLLSIDQSPSINLYTMVFETPKTRGIASILPVYVQRFPHL